MAVRQCVPNACGEASVNPTSALRFDATAFGERWSQLLFCFQSLSSHWRGGLGGQWLATDPPSHTCSSILMEHCSSHSYLSSLTVTYCNLPGQPNLMPVLSVKLSLNLSFSHIELTAICNMWLLVYCLVSISTVECKFPWRQVPNWLCLIHSTVFINKCMLIKFLNFIFLRYMYLSKQRKKIRRTIKHHLFARQSSRYYRRGHAEPKQNMVHVQLLSNLVLNTLFPA